MTEEAVQRAALELRQAFLTGAIAPIADRLVPNDAALGYRIQEINTAHWIAGGRKLAGRKIGLTSTAVQTQLGVDEPDFGMLFTDMQIAPGGSFAAKSVSQPRAEGELAFCIARDLSAPFLDEAAVVGAIEWMAPAIEVVGSRVRDWRIKIVDTVADNASSALYAIGDDRRPYDRAAVDGLTMELFEDGDLVSHGPATACLGSPVTALTWLARKMVEVGRPLAAGDIVLSGAFGPLVPIAPGRCYRLAMAGFADLTIECSD